MDVSCGKSSVLGLPPAGSILGVGGTGSRLLAAKSDGAAGEGEKRAKLQLQVQEQTIAGVLILNTLKPWEGRGRESEVSAAISECLLCC